MKKVLAVILTVACSTVAMAQEPICEKASVGLHLGSYHMNTKVKFNNFNPGVYATCNDWVAGAYFNSEENWSAYAGKNFSYHIAGPISAEATVGIITGYGKPLPMVLPGAKWQIDKEYSARAVFVPGIFRAPNTLHFTVEKSANLF